MPAWAPWNSYTGQSVLLLQFKITECWDPMSWQRETEKRGKGDGPGAVATGRSLSQLPVESSIQSGGKEGNVVF